MKPYTETRTYTFYGNLEEVMKQMNNVDFPENEFMVERFHIETHFGPPTNTQDVAIKDVQYIGSLMLGRISK